ncbi:TonB-dependent receptor [Candidatus Venteria ishoeyi]|uniref:TonB-dependent receptor domain-containing protein n=1 Tax=Candidatus Venteria ishoeyi TaxID=1899563 RepID=UPI0025A63300|nr:TonB-dependent receptor [Candidatus Venteria ishoeyi]MDM8545691.1 TonB-dependent receptor [Candidatus Venteria ishoeyi]
MKTLYFGSPVLFSVLVSSAFASEATQLPDMVVTASRTPETVESTLAAITIIQRADIERQQATSLPEVLRSVVGVDISQSGNAGQPASLFMRGSNASHVLVMIDGIKIGSPTLGLSALYLLPLSEVERIEVVRGARSSLYGSEAIGGVIQIFTRTGSPQTISQLKLSAGSFRTWQVEAGIQGSAGEGTFYNLSASSLKSRGFDTCKPDLGAGCFTDEPDRDAYRNTAFSGKIRHHLNQDVSLGAHFLRAQGRTEYDSSFQNQADFVQQVWGLSADVQATNIWELRLQAGESRDDADNFGHGLAQAVFNTKRQQFSWVNEINFNTDQQLILGYDYLRDRADSTTAYIEDSRKNEGFYGQYRDQFERWRFQLALRHDKNQQFGHQQTGNIALAYEVSKQLRARLSYATAFNAPSFNWLYYPGFGNAELSPEKSKNLELGLSGQLANVTWSVQLYENKVKDLIASIFNPADGSFLPQNVHKARIRGLELEARWQLPEDWQINANLALSNPKDQDSEKILPRRARQTLNLELVKQLGKTRLSAHLLAQGQRYEDSQNSIKLAGYGLLNLRAAYALNEHWTLRGKIDNIFNKDYETAYRYTMPGRTFWLSIQYQGKH